MSDENEIYTMEKVPRGFCVIINYFLYNHLDDDSLKDRIGSDYDVDNLKILFGTKLHFDVIIPEEIQLEEKNVIEILDDIFGKKNFNQHDAIVVLINSHGNSNGIYCSNGDLIQFNQIINKLNDINCKTLQNKPKILLIDCCREIDIICQRLCKLKL